MIGRIRLIVTVFLSLSTFVEPSFSSPTWPNVIPPRQTQLEPRRCDDGPGKSHINTRRPNDDLKRRQVTTSELSTCGYRDGNPSISRVANTGYGCRTDAEHGLWGFCKTTVTELSNCGFVGNCFDNTNCADGCGIIGATGVRTITCPSTLFCSTDYLTFGIDEVYTYMGCGPEETKHYLATPTAAIVTTTDPPLSTTSLSSSSSVSLTSSASGLGTLQSQPASSTSFSHLPSSSQRPDDSPSLSSPGATSVPERSSQGGTSSTSTIIGSTLGGVALVGLIILGSIYLLRRSPKGDRHPGVGTTPEDAKSPMSTSTWSFHQGPGSYPRLHAETALSQRAELDTSVPDAQLVGSRAS